MHASAPRFLGGVGQLGMDGVVYGVGRPSLTSIFYTPYFVFIAVFNIPACRIFSVFDVFHFTVFCLFGVVYTYEIFFFFSYAHAIFWLVVHFLNLCPLLFAMVFKSFYPAPPPLFSHTHFYHCPSQNLMLQDDMQSETAHPSRPWYAVLHFMKYWCTERMIMQCSTAKVHDR